MKSKFKFQVFPSRQDRKKNSSVRFLGEVMARQFCFEMYWPLWHKWISSFQENWETQYYQKNVVFQETFSTEKLPSFLIRPYWLYILDLLWASEGCQLHCSAPVFPLFIRHSCSKGKDEKKSFKLKNFQTNFNTKFGFPFQTICKWTC